MNAGNDDNQVWVLRAPQGDNDYLNEEQVARYLSLLREEDQQALSSPAFEKSIGAASISESQVSGAALSSTVRGCFAPLPPRLRQAFSPELSETARLAFVLQAYRRDKGISSKDLPAFLRFCIAYRIHCYFETSRQPSQSSNGRAPVSSGRPEVVFVLGGPGAGKGTQCARIANTFGYKHLSAGDLLREERKRPGSKLGELIESCIQEGKLVPVDIVVQLLMQAMQAHCWDGGRYLVDGFPRSFENLEGWTRVVGDRVRMSFAIFFDVPEAVMEARLLERGKTSGRSDDNLEAIRKRFRTFHEESMPVVEKFRAEGLLRSIHAEASVEEVWHSVQAVFGPTIVFVLGGTGAGKGTQCRRMSSTFGYTHLSVGDLLREECERDQIGERGKLLTSCIREGKLVPSEISVQLLKEKMTRLGYQGKKYVIDGFPRSFDNLEAWNKIIGDQALVKFCLYLECSEGVMEARALHRAETSGRIDDNLESIQKRFATFYHHSMPVIGQYRAEGLLRRIDAEKGLEEVWADVQQLFGPSVVFVLGGPGAGKGTQCKRIADTFGYKHISVGDLLRAERQRPLSEASRLISGQLQDDRLVRSEIVVKLLQRTMQELGWEGGKYLIDGFPRSFENLEAWQKILGNSVHVRFTLCFECPMPVMEARLLSKARANGGPSDADRESIQKRFRVLQQESMPVVDALYVKGNLHRIDAEPPVDEVWEEVRKLFGPSVIFVLGGPGAGKGTQCEKIALNYGYMHLSAGDLLREERKRPGSELGELIESHIKEGKLVPAEVTLKLLQKSMEEHGWEGGKYLIDGFPRSFDNLEGWNRMLGSKVTVKLALFFECAEETMEARLLDRGKSSGRSDDNLEAIKKRFQVFQTESMPVVQKLETTGVLRKIDAEQDKANVWHCVNEVLQVDLDINLPNYALVMIKPHATNAETERFVQSVLTTHKVTIVKFGSVAVSDLLDRGLFDRQYVQIMQYATGDPKSIQVPASGLESFKAATGVAWSEAIAAGSVLNATDAATALGSAKTLADAWQESSSSTVKLCQGCQVASLSRSGKIFFVVNGFALHWRDTFGTGADHVKWFAVSFSPAKLSWRQFRAEILGATNPAEAPADSIRGLFYQHWATLGLSACPDTLNNCVHASGGPLEGLREWMLWADVQLTNHPLARSLLVAGVPREMLEVWLENDQVEDWRLGALERTSGPIFSCTEECDHAVFRRSALHYVRRAAASGGRSLECWTATESQLQGPVSRLMTADGLSRQISHGSVKSLSPRGNSKKPATEKASVITLLHFNDVYNVEPRKKEPVGGIARFVTRMRELKAEAQTRKEPAMCLFSGDAFNPSLTSTVTLGRHMVPALNAVGIDIACYGNHDFDFGVDSLVEMAGESNFPWLISNVVDKDTGDPLANGVLTHMMEWHGRKIGFMGLVEREWLVTLHTIEPEDVIYEDFCPCGKRLGKQLRDEGAELVIALTHMRVPNDELLAHEVPEVDIILGGHDHHYDVKPVGPHGTYVLKSGTDFRDITMVRLEFNDSGKPRENFKVVESQHVEILSTIAEDAEMKVLVDDCTNKVGKAMDNVIGTSAVDLDCRFQTIRTRESNIGNYITDVMRSALKTDIAVINSGTLRADSIIEKGKIRVRDLLSILPMLDELCVIELSGEQVLDVLENGVSQYPRLEGRFLQVSGVTFEFDASKAGGSRLVEGSVLVAGQKLDPAARYRICTLNYMRGGKDGFGVLKTALCLKTGEEAGILPAMVRENFKTVQALNGTLDSAVGEYRTRRASDMLHSPESPANLKRVGEGPDPLKQYAISPVVEGRIRCLNPAPECT